MKEIYDYSMPAEWEEHERTIIEWPVKESLIWPENHEEVCLGYAEVINAISGFEEVTVIVNRDTEAEARKLCTSGAEFLTIPHNDAWCRDNGPTFVRNPAGDLAGINWRFNAWGDKYSSYDLDNRLAPAILKHYRVPVFNSSMVLEGGSFHVDGEGTLITTGECLLNPNRNPALSREDIAAELKKRLNVSKIIWLARGLDGDETDGHVDNIACFAGPGTLLFQACHDRKDANYGITNENLEILGAQKDAAGRDLEIITISQPPVRSYRGGRLTLSYLNLYFVNSGIILPVFGGDAEKTDHEAAGILRELYPGRRIMPVNGMALVKEGGNVHCITQQVPAGRRKS